MDDIQQLSNDIKLLNYSINSLVDYLKKSTDAISRENISKGDLKIQRYRDYYDVSHTITTALPTPVSGILTFDDVGYNRERIFTEKERYGEIVTVSNDGIDTLFVIISHGGETNFSQEVPIYPGETKTYFNVWELRLRSPTLGLPYRVTEYKLLTCCDVSQTGGATSAQFTPIEKGVIHNQALPAINTDFFVPSLSPTNTPCTFRIQAAISIVGNLLVTITRGGNTQTLTLNVIPGPALVADGLYIFDVLVHSGDTINLQYSATGGTIRVIRIQELDAGTS